MKILSLSIALATLVAACNTGTSNSTNTDSTGAKSGTPIDSNAPAPSVGYMRLQGSINNAPAVMHLTVTPKTVTGFYYLVSDGKPVSLYFAKPNNNPASDSLEGSDYIYDLSNYNSENYRERSWKIKILAQGLKGTIKDPSHGNTYSIDFKVTYPEGSYTMDVIYTEDSAVLVKDKKESPVNNSYYTVFSNGGNKPFGDWFNDIIIDDIDYDKTKPKSKSIAEAISRNLNTEFSTYVPDSVAPDGDYDDAMLDYYSSNTMTALYNDKDYFVYDNYATSYSGGAHGLESDHYQCIDVKNKKKMGIFDVFTADTSFLTPLLTQSLKEALKLSPNADLRDSFLIYDDPQIHPGESFFFTDKGVGFGYVPYEVTSYATGNFYVFIPYNKLQGKLNPEFAKRMGL